MTKEPKPGQQRSHEKHPQKRAREGFTRKWEEARSENERGPVLPKAKQEKTGKRPPTASGRRSKQKKRFATPPETHRNLREGKVRNETWDTATNPSRAVKKRQRKTGRKVDKRRKLGLKGNIKNGSGGGEVPINTKRKTADALAEHTKKMPEQDTVFLRPKD